jgi:hypothetical protein
MSELTDELKRLEQAGSANAEASKRLVEAAAQLADLIVDQFEARDRYVESIAPAFRRSRYSVLNGRLVNAESRYVAENRDAALAFAQDIAGGLLDSIVGALEQRTAESRQALAPVEEALRRLR